MRTANIARKRPENAPGPFFVDDECISCGACWQQAPRFLASHEVHAFAFFIRQPLTEEEALFCRDAIFLCPVGAIGEEKAI